MRRDIYQEITSQIVRELEKGTVPWHRPWSASYLDGRAVLPLRHNAIPYRGVNILALWMAAMANGYGAPAWMTFRQALALGGFVRRGEKGSLTVYASALARSETDEATGQSIESEIHYLKGYTVFNVEQIDGLPQHYYANPEPVLSPLQRIASAETFFAATRASIRHGGNAAYYAIADDRIQMPPGEKLLVRQGRSTTRTRESAHAYL